jgi:glutathionyl-hydroquinone reductase
MRLARLRAIIIPALRERIDALNARIYDTVNNGVYKAGFATSQAAYEEAVAPLFASLDWLEGLLGEGRYLTGDRLTEADIRLFTTLIRFDAVYVGHFKCNIRRIADYPNLSGFVRDLYQTRASPRRSIWGTSSVITTRVTGAEPDRRGAGGAMARFRRAPSPGVRRR